MEQVRAGCDMPQDNYQSSPPKHMILKMLAVTALVVAVRVAATVAMTGGTSAPPVAPKSKKLAPLIEPSRTAMAEVKLRGPCGGVVEDTRCR